jgi:hypothetical protein
MIVSLYYKKVVAVICNKQQSIITMAKHSTRLFTTGFQITYYMEKDVLTAYTATADQLLKLTSTFEQDGLNRVPFSDSWTAAQVIVHVTKSNYSIAQALTLPAKEAHRKPDDRVDELKNIFLDFTTKLKSPDFILPLPGLYNKTTVIADLENSIHRLKEASTQHNLSEAISHSAFGNITKLELLHFVVYHTKRHIHQLKNIFEVIENR